MSIEPNLVSVATFNKLAQQYQDKYMDCGLYASSLSAFCQLLADAPLRVLELGCGPGNVSQFLLSQRPQLAIYGIDLAPNMIELARQNNPQARYDVMDCRQLHLLDGHGPFDVVIAAFCAPYLHDDEVEQLLIDSRAKMSHGAKLYFSTMVLNQQLASTGQLSTSANTHVAQSGWQTAQAGDRVYIYYHSLERIKVWCQQAGFVIDSEELLSDERHLQSSSDVFIVATAS